MKVAPEHPSPRAISRRRFLQNFGMGTLSVSALGSLAATTRKAQKLKAGVAKREITPPIWVPYLTSSGNGTSAPFKGLHDRLHARALVLDDGKQAIAVLSV